MFNTYINIPHHISDAPKLQQVLRSWILVEHQLTSILSTRHSITDPPSNSSATPEAGVAVAGTTATTTAPTRHTRSHLLPHPAYDLVISVLNPDPAAQHVHWDVRAAAAAYLQPLFAAVRPLARFTIKSQWLYQVALDHPVRTVADAASPGGRHFALDERDQSNVITALEGRLGQPISDHPTLHLIVYAVPCASAPLYLYDGASGQRLPTAAGAIEGFLALPKWGGVVIANPPAELCRTAAAEAQKIDVPVNTAGVMQSLLYIVRRLLDVQNEIRIGGAQMEPLAGGRVEPRSFELDALMRGGCVQLVHSAQLTLQSLVQLLDGIGNIVIDETVGRAVHEAFENARLAKRLLAENRLEAALAHARRAFDAAERAFYDPSMLALLYFPDDQKFAIYIPLFLPILLPVFMSLIELWRYWFGRKGDVGEVVVKEAEVVEDHRKTE